MADTPSRRIAEALADSPAIKALKLSNSIKAFSGIADQLKHNYGALNFSEAYALVIDEGFTVEHGDSVSSDSENTQSRISTAPFNRSESLSIFAILLAMYLSYLSQMSANESEIRILEKIDDLKEAVVTMQSNVSHSTEVEHVFLVTDREVNLRTGPSSGDYEVIEILPKNKKVMELERSRDWVKIEIFDYMDNTSKVGWVHSKFLLKDFEPQPRRKLL